jgi:hypothetical protein
MILQIDFGKENDKKKLFGVLKSRKPKVYTIEIKEFRKDRSSLQNRYYWGVVIKELCNHTGYNADEMHELLKAKFNPKELVFKKTGESIKIGGSTAELDTLDFENYLEQIRIFALSDLDVLIPLPNQEK